MTKLVPLIPNKPIKGFAMPAARSAFMEGRSPPIKEFKVVVTTAGYTDVSSPPVCISSMTFTNIAYPPKVVWFKL